MALHEKHAHDLSLDELVAAFYAVNPEADQTIYGNLFDQLAKATITPDVGRDVVEQTLLRKRALKLSELAFQVASGVKTQDELNEFIANNKAEPTAHQTTLPEVSTDLEDLLSNHVYDQGLRWRLDCLNKSLGSLRRGDFGFIFARPETGKTTFLASEITNMLSGCEAPIIWLNNEEDGWKVMLRVYCAYFGVTSDVILANVRKWRDAFREQVGNRFRLFDSAAIGRRDVENVILRLNPALVVYDQIDKIKGFANDREDLRLGSIYQWARELAKGNHAAIGVCQADGQAEGVRYLTMEHVANAKTAKQAEADFILGIGKTGDPAQATARFLNISKNKLLGDKDSISDLRHGRFEVLIEPTIARYTDVIKFN
jgi:replicative DNA helicase